MQLGEIDRLIAGRYRVLGELGKGGMAAVFLALDTRDGREVALKRLQVSGRAMRTASELFEREFHTLSQLAHPRIIEVYDYGVDEEGAFYTMELLGGQDLHALGTVPWQRACALLRDVASSLAILHSRRLVHGDVSPRNVRCTSDGRAKLLDFGAMMPMGPTRKTVGTPPFAAPEMVQLQTLDGRTDLFGLGALGYWLLTGQNAYPARNFRHLRGLWHCAVRPPHELAPETPMALGELVMECLQLNREERPRSAGVVMERLCAIASLPFDEHRDVAAAYLTTPKLIGRDRELATVRASLSALVQGKGSTLVVTGPPGSGRSRFLEAGVLEAKLHGASVIRAEPGAAGFGEYDVVASICRQLFEIAPSTASRAARFHGSWLAHLLGSELTGSDPSPEAPSRRHMLAAVRDFVLSAARGLRLVIAIDDAERIDEQSSSVLVALAQKTRRRPLCLLLSTDSEGEGSATLDLLDNIAQKIELTQLDEEQTEVLIRSVFGQPAHSLTLARGIHRVAGGNPRSTMQLLAHLVEREVVRYEAGSFLLPEQLHERDIPDSVAEALTRRLAKLSPDARELACPLALSEPAELELSQHVKLTDHGDRGRTFRALDELVRIELLAPQGERYRLTDATWRGVAAASLDNATRHRVHRRLAEIFEEHGTVARRAYHWMEADEPMRAIEVLLAQYLKDPLEPRDPLEGFMPGLLDLLERAARASDELDLAPGLRVELRMKAAGASQFVGDVERFMRIAPPLLEQLKRESGLDDYALADPSLEPMARLTEALTRTQERFDATPEGQRGLAPVDAVRELSRLCAMFGGVAGVEQSTWPLDGLPSLEPLLPLSPAIEVIERMIGAVRLAMEGRGLRSLEQAEWIIERLGQPDKAGLGELYANSIRLGAAYIAGIAEASLGLPRAADRVRPLESVTGHRVNAQRVHAASALMLGDLEGATAAQRRAELVMLQDGQHQRYPGTTARTELVAYALLDDLPAVKQLTERISTFAKTYPAWRFVVQVGHFHHHRIKGDFEGALAALRGVVTEATPVKHRDWALVAAAHVQALTLVGRCEEAATLGLAHMQVCREHEQQPGYSGVALATAEALLAARNRGQATVLLDDLIEEANSLGVRGLPLGMLYEFRARAAIEAGEQETFSRYTELCAEQYRLDSAPTLARRYRKLLREATTRSGDAPNPPRAPNMPLTAGPSVDSSALSRLLECSDREERASCALRILAEQVEPEHAYLYGLREGELSLLCTLPVDAPIDDALHDAVEEFLERELAMEADATIAVDTDHKSEQGVEDGSDSVVTRDEQVLAFGDGSRACAVALMSMHEGYPVLAGVAVFRVGSGAYRPPAVGTLEPLAAALLEHDDVDPVTCIA